MPSERHRFLIKSSTPPTIEADPQVRAIYIRFKNAPVAKTVGHPCESMHIAIDLDQKGDVIGIEAVGLDECSIHAVQLVLRKAAVEAPNVEFSRARFVPTNMVAA